MKQLRLLLPACALALLPALASAQTPPAPAQATAPPLDVAAVDAVVARTLKAFDVPGISVAVVKDGQLVLAKGYGVRSLATKAPMDANTLVGIASNSKAFMTAALGLLVEEGKLRWDDKVTDYTSCTWASLSLCSPTRKAGLPARPWPTPSRTTTWA